MQQYIEDRKTWLLNIDYPTLCMFIALVAIGLLMISTVTAPENGYPASPAEFLLDTDLGKQLIWTGLSAIVFLVIMLLLDWTIWTSFAYGIYVIGVLLLIGVLLVGTEIKGATSWYTFGGVSFQPAEIAKFGTCLAVAAYLSQNGVALRRWPNVAVTAGLWLFPSALILLQPDAGSALVFFSFLILMFREGLSPGIYIIGGFAVAMFVTTIMYGADAMIVFLLIAALLIYAAQQPKQLLWWIPVLSLVVFLSWALWDFGLFWYLFGISASLFVGASLYQLYRRRARTVLLIGIMVGVGILLTQTTNYAFNELLQSHQQERINVWLQPEKTDIRGARYNVWQSQLAISAGGMTGKGLGQGTLTRNDYVPEQETDFIFCAVGEEQGFVGSMAVIFLFVLLLMRLITIAERQRLRFARIYAYGVVGIIFIHVVVNIGMTMGLMPIIGIPLPFISKGGSSLLGFTIMLAVLLKLDKHRNRTKLVRLPT
jgi:rod shape determining protein RodA